MANEKKGERKKRNPLINNAFRIESDTTSD